MAAARKREQAPPVQVQELANQIARVQAAPGYVLRGDERYFRDSALKHIRTSCERESFEVCLHNAERGNPDFRLSALIDDLSGSGLFAARRLVVIQNGGDQLKKTSAGPSSLTTAILNFLATKGESGTVVLSLPTLRADHALPKAVLAAGGAVLSLRKLWDTPPPWNPDPRQTELVQWVRDRARELKVRLSPDQAVYVAAATGNDLFALQDQLVRLGRMPEADLEELVGWNGATAPWTVAENVVAGDAARALGGIEMLFRSGFQEKSGRRLLDTTALSTMLISALGREVRRSLHLALELERGTPEAEAASALGLNGRVQGPALARARQRPARFWRSMLQDVADLERAAKSGAGVDANHFCHLVLAWKLQKAQVKA